jgi:uncharacterized protein
VLAVLYGHADQSFYLRQLVRAIGAGHGALQRELQHLTYIGLILRRTQGNQVLYQANSQSAIFPEIKSLITNQWNIEHLIEHGIYAEERGRVLPEEPLFSWTCGESERNCVK